MKKALCFLVALLSAVLLAGCAADSPDDRQIGIVAPSGTGTGTPDAPSSANDWALTPCRIVDGAGTGNLLLAGLDDGQVYTLATEGLVVVMDGGSSSADALRDGMPVDVGYAGMLMETFPTQFAEPKTLAGHSDQVDDRCGLYLQVLEDLWTVDPGLHSDISQLGMDLSDLTDLSESERSAIAWQFGQLHGVEPISGTYEDLVAQGYIDGEALVWDAGCLFSLSGNAQDGFQAQKWRSGDGAYFFTDCTAQMDQQGHWTYQVGAEAIS